MQIFFDVNTVTRTFYFNNVMDTIEFEYIPTFAYVSTFNIHARLPGNNCKIDLRKSKRGKQHYY